MYTTTVNSETAAPTSTNLSALILRLGLAIIFLFHGQEKIMLGDAGASWVNEMYSRLPDRQSFKPESERSTLPELPVSLTFMGTQLVVSWGEFLGGLALAAGLLTRLAALGMILIQIGAAVLVTIPRAYFMRGGMSYEFEFNLILIVMCLALLILGPGKWSIDNLLARRRSRQAAAIPAAAPASVPLTGSSVPAEQSAQGAAS